VKITLSWTIPSRQRSCGRVLNVDWQSYSTNSGYVVHADEIMSEKKSGGNDPEKLGSLVPPLAHFGLCKCLIFNELKMQIFGLVSKYQFCDFGG